MSWQSYVDTNLVGTGEVTSAAIVGHKGGVSKKDDDDDNNDNNRQIGISDQWLLCVLYLFF